MKNHSLRIFGLCLLFVAGGCKTNVPMVEHHPGTFQTKVQAAEHWKIMANEVVERIASDLNFREKWIFVDAPGEVTPFSEAYRKLVISELMRRSLKVAAVPDVAELRLSVTGQLVRHGKFRFLSNPTSIFSAIAFEYRNFLVGDETGSDWQTRKELLVTTQVQERTVLRFSHTQIVYVSPMDASLYTAESTAAPIYQSDWPATEAKARAAIGAQW